MAQSFFVYILRCSDGSFYVGHTRNLNMRLARHNEGHGSAWTVNRRPVELVYHERHASKESAIRRERQLKKWSRAKKQCLVDCDFDQLKALSQRKSD